MEKIFKLEDNSYGDYCEIEFQVEPTFVECRVRSKQDDAHIFYTMEVSDEELRRLELFAQRVKLIRAQSYLNELVDKVSLVSDGVLLLKSDGNVVVNKAHGMFTTEVLSTITELAKEYKEILERVEHERLKFNY